MTFLALFFLSQTCPNLHMHSLYFIKREEDQYFFLKLLVNISVVIFMGHGIIKIGLTVLGGYFLRVPLFPNFHPLHQVSLHLDIKDCFFVENNETKAFMKQPRLVWTKNNLLAQWESSGNKKRWKKSSFWVAWGFVKQRQKHVTDM